MNNSLSTWLRNIFFILIIIQLLGPAIQVITSWIESVVQPKTKVAVVTIKDDITDSTTYVRQLKEYFEDKNIHAILLTMDTPGGYPGASQAIWHVVRELKNKYPKPVIAWIQNICASGGYYIASAADHIVATPAALVGSIGVYMPQWRLNDFIEQWHLHYTTIKAGTYKTTTNPLLPEPTPEQTAALQAMITDTYEQFLADIRISRPHLVGSETNWADGRIFTAHQAYKLGLIDELGAQITVEAAIKRLGKITTEIEFVYPKKPGLLSKLFSKSNDDSDDGNTYIESFAHAICRYIISSQQNIPLLRSF